MKKLLKECRYSKSAEREREKKKERGLPIVLVIEGAHNEYKIKQSFHKYTFEI